METTRGSRPRPFRDWLVFCFIVLLLAAAAAVVSFRIGRDWLGKRLSSVEISGGAPRIVAQARVDPEELARSEAEAKAPAAPLVTVEDREPTQAEKRKAETEEALKEPQDGAQFNEAEEARKRKEALFKPEPEPLPAPDEGAATDAGASSGARMFVVTAGSYLSPDNASKVLAQLAAKGYSPYVETVTRDGKTFQRINVAVVRGREKAEALRDELVGNGFTSGVLAVR